MIDSVKAVSANSLREPLERTGIHRGGFRQSTVKAGVKNGHLRNITKAIFDDFDSIKFSAVVQWRKNGHPCDCRFDLRGDDCRVLEFFSAVNDTMSNHIDFRRS